MKIFILLLISLSVCVSNAKAENCTTGKIKGKGIFHKELSSKAENSPFPYVELGEGNFSSVLGEAPYISREIQQYFYAKISYIPENLQKLKFPIIPFGIRVMESMWQLLIIELMSLLIHLVKK